MTSTRSEGPAFLIQDFSDRAREEAVTGLRHIADLLEAGAPLVEGGICIMPRKGGLRLSADLTLKYSPTTTGENGNDND